jgi:hypothetical protein
MKRNSREIGFVSNLLDSKFIHWNKEATLTEFVLYVFISEQLLIELWLPAVKTILYRSVLLPSPLCILHLLPSK